MIWTASSPPPAQQPTSRPSPFRGRPCALIPLPLRRQFPLKDSGIGSDLNRKDRVMERVFGYIMFAVLVVVAALGVHYWH